MIKFIAKPLIKVAPTTVVLLTVCLAPASLYPKVVGGSRTSLLASCFTHSTRTLVPRPRKQEQEDKKSRSKKRGATHHQQAGGNNKKNKNTPIPPDGRYREVGASPLLPTAARSWVLVVWGPLYVKGSYTTARSASLLGKSI